MLIDIIEKANNQLDIDSGAAFRILCKTLDMEYILSMGANDFFVRKDHDGEIRVYQTRNGHDKLYDDRGMLFIALCNVAVNIFPNLEFRNTEYIYE